jgi:hypothetical protein
MSVLACSTSYGGEIVGNAWPLFVVERLGDGVPRVWVRVRGWAGLLKRWWYAEMRVTDATNTSLDLRW